MNPGRPYFAVIFTSRRTSADDAGYDATSGAMMELAREQPGFLGVEHARESIGITISYWDSLQSIADWKAHADHRLAREKGKETWYEAYHIRICRVEREYSFQREDTTDMP